MVTVCVIVALTGPDIASAHDQFSVTSPLFQPFPFAGVRFKNVMIGLVASRFKVRGVAFDVSPARLVQEPLKVTPAVSCE